MHLLDVVSLVLAACAGYGLPEATSMPGPASETAPQPPGRVPWGHAARFFPTRPDRDRRGPPPEQGDDTSLAMAQLVEERLRTPSG